MRHEWGCRRGGDCPICEARIAQIEDDREHDDLPDYYDGT